MKYIDMEKWDRKEHFDLFYSMDYPQYNVCLNIDISDFLSFTKRSKLSFYYAMIYAVMEAVNNTDEFKYRIREGKVVLHDKVIPSFTDMGLNNNPNLFKIVTVDFKGDIFKFEEHAKNAAKNQSVFLEKGDGLPPDNLIYISCLPWISFTHVSHTISLNNCESVPRVTWGKYFMDNSRMMLPISVQVNHALVDGWHIALFIDNLKKVMKVYI